MKKIISAILVMATIFSLMVPAFAVYQPEDEVVTTVLEDNENIRKVRSMLNEITYVTEYEKKENTLTVSEMKDGIAVDSVFIDLNEAMVALYSNDGDQKEDGKRIDYEHTFLNYEYEEYLFDNYPGDAFWYLRHPQANPEERSVYEHPINGSEYTTSIDEYVGGVDKINSAEGIIGIVGVAAIASWLVTKGIIPLPELYAGIQAVLEGIGITGVASASYNLSKGIKACDTAWQELFGAFD